MSGVHFFILGLPYKTTFPKDISDLLKQFFIEERQRMYKECIVNPRRFLE